MPRNYIETHPGYGMPTDGFTAYMAAQLGAVQADRTIQIMDESYRQFMQGKYAAALRTQLQVCSQIPRGVNPSAFLSKGAEVLARDFQAARETGNEDEVQKHAWLNVVWHYRWIRRLVEEEPWYGSWNPDRQEQFLSAGIIAAWKITRNWHPQRGVLTNYLKKSHLADNTWKEFMKESGLGTSTDWVDYISPYRQARAKLLSHAGNSRGMPAEERELFASEELAYYLVSLRQDRENKSLSYPKWKEMEAVTEYYTWVRTGGEYALEIIALNKNHESKSYLRTVIRERITRLHDIVQNIEPASLQRGVRVVERDAFGQVVEGWRDLEEFIADPDASTVDAAEYRILQQHIGETLNRLPPRERRILIARYGLSGGPEMSLDDIGRREGITRERVRQVIACAFSRLSHPSVRAKLRAFLGDSTG